MHYNNRLDISQFKEIPAIYIFTNKINKKQYVGESLNLKGRLRKYNNLKDDRIFNKALKKYGFEGFNLEIIYKPFYTKENLLAMEASLIRELDTLIPYGYNLVSEGSGSKGYKHSKETLERLSRSKTGENNPSYGKTGSKHPMSKAICQFSKDGEFIAEFAGLTEAGRLTRINKGDISLVCNAYINKKGYKIKSAGGFIWKFKSDC
jgi:hypothetical protein